jgi:hypothetical protein
MFAAVHADIASWHPIRARQRNYRDRFHDNGDTLHARCQVDKIVPREWRITGLWLYRLFGPWQTFCHIGLADIFHCKGWEWNKDHLLKRDIKLLPFQIPTS